MFIIAVCSLILNIIFILDINKWKKICIEQNEAIDEAVRLVKLANKEFHEGNK